VDELQVARLNDREAGEKLENGRNSTEIGRGTASKDSSGPLSCRLPPAADSRTASLLAVQKQSITTGQWASRISVPRLDADQFAGGRMVTAPQRQ